MEIEFASKEDLEAIKADPKLQKVYNAMVAGVQKKFQEFAGEKKSLEEALGTAQEETEELTGALGEWEGWFTKNKPHLDRYSQMIKSGKLSEDGEQRRLKKQDNGNEDGDARFNDVISKVNEAGERWMKQVEGKMGHLNRMLGFSMELNELMRSNPKIDPQKVLDTALKGKHRSLTDAYKEAYGDDILNEQVETKLKTRVDEEVKKRSANLETGSGSVPFSLELPKELPKSFTAAGKEFLEERAKDLASGGNSDRSQDKGGKI
jgi:hypothetical protein